MEDSAEVRCPWCGELQELWIDPQSAGEMIQDCDVCCRPWRVVVSRDERGQLQVWVDRA
ncbi:CPXCG motif-containing cysteine-rich protein [Pseudenhygromyxa sp. WMMC2535]|nr:CPXCG motif-containing cysteine-rich protein [Pseudenhygromyxa sp. WMMC2535]NVB39061.1 CPXCG motif-containing cysteine-rich protein [Pseudenhygromyxa sp. WMMC2535]